MSFALRGRRTKKTILPTRGAAVETIKSRDGTQIAFDRIGQGPPVILVGGAFSCTSISRGAVSSSRLTLDRVADLDAGSLAHRTIQPQ
jgi:hypothetical protein